jgi:hypothetical protein
MNVHLKIVKNIKRLTYLQIDLAYVYSNYKTLNQQSDNICELML